MPPGRRPPGRVGKKEQSWPWLRVIVLWSFFKFYYLCVCDGLFWLSTWLDWGMPRKLVEWFWRCLCGCFLRRLVCGKAPWWSAASNRLGAAMEQKIKWKEGKVARGHTPSFLKHVCFLLLAVAVDIRLQILQPMNVDLNKQLSRGLLRLPPRTGPAPLVSVVLRLLTSWTEQLWISPSSPACRRPLWDWSASNHLTNPLL
jgi:hypothetical protein